MSRRAFTLTELLVVLAILVFVGAVLFPVFQTARSAADRSTCLSNFRQATLAASLYRTDYDFSTMPVNYRPENLIVTGLGNSATDRTWIQMLMPYTRPFSVFRCPADTTARPRPDALFDEDLVAGDVYSQFYRASMRTNLGYNFMYLSPILVSASGARNEPRNEAQMHDGTLLFVDSVHRVENGRPQGGGNWLVVPPCRFDENNLDSIADSAGTARLYSPSLGWSRRGTYQFGAAWPWHGDRLTVAYLGGNVESLTMAELTEGCDARPNWTGRIQDEGYRWDLRP